MPRALAAATATLTALAAPLAAGAATLDLDDDDALVSIAECVNRANEPIAMEWDLGGASGDTVELLGSSASGCSETDATTAVLVDGLETGQTSYPESGDQAVTVGDVLSAAGKDPGDCEGQDFRVYLCVRLLDTSGDEVVTASATVHLQLERPPPPTGLSVKVGEEALYVSWTEGTATASAPASSETYQAFAEAGGVAHASSETSDTSTRVSGLENGTTYDVWAVAYSEAGNASEPSELTVGTPQPVLDFHDVYQASGGSEAGGCSHAGGAGVAAMVAAALAASAATRRRRRRAPGEPGARGGHR